MYVSLPRQNCLLNDVSNGSIFINFYHTADTFDITFKFSTRFCV